MTAVDATSGPVDAGRWLTVGRAAAIIGVDAATVRRWADSGELRSFRTPGAHRRVAEEDVRALVERAPSALGPILTADVRQHAGAALRRGAWLESLTPGQAHRYRELGRQLVQCASQAFAGKERASDVEHTVDRLGDRYGELLLGDGARLSDAIEAFIVFRGALLEATSAAAGRHLLDTPARTEARHRVGMLSDRLLLRIAAAYAGRGRIEGLPQAA